MGVYRFLLVEAAARSRKFTQQRLAIACEFAARPTQARCIWYLPSSCRFEVLTRQVRLSRVCARSRGRHVELDLAIRDAYGWQTLPLDHDFYEVETLAENDRVRYTISPAARKELLRRLLALNHTRAEAEKATAKPTKPKRSENAATPQDRHLPMFADEAENQ